MSGARVLPVLMYHHVSPSPGLVTVSPENFRAQMQDLADSGWTTVGAEDVAVFLAGGKLPKKSVAITFDDGYLDNYLHAYPALREFDLRAIIFAVTGWVGDGPVRTREGQPVSPNHKACKAAIGAGAADTVMLRWSEVEAMAGRVEVHSHTHSHTRWDRTLSDRMARRQALADDLGKSRQVLQERLGQTGSHLCWPQGYFDADYIDVAEASGFRHLYTTHRHLNTRRTPAADIGRVDTRDKGAGWLTSRLALYTAPVLGSIYCALRGGQ